MPGWHAAAKKFLEQGELNIVGIVEEQHPDRARLFMQWKEMDWPLFVDAMNLLEVPHVPITLLLDEAGIIRQISPPLRNAEKVLAKFMREGPTVPDQDEEPVAAPHPERLEPKNGAPAKDWLRYGEALVLWRAPNALDEAIEAFQRAAKAEAHEAAARFRMGVAFRMRFDSKGRLPGDFQQAVTSWERALDCAPNNYIYRRRIQQYGPRLDKPYPFYDWVDLARKEIEERGETPVTLTAEPGGAELATPIRHFNAASRYRKPPDPEEKIALDEGFIKVETVVVPSAVKPGETARIHVMLQPDSERKAQWHNGSGGLVVWIEPPKGWIVDESLHTFPDPTDLPMSNETRRIEFEIRSPRNARQDARVRAYACYYVCEDETGRCLYRRQNMLIRVPVK